MKIKILSKQYPANVKHKTNTVQFELDGRKIYIDIMYIDSPKLEKRNVFVGNNRYDELEEYINKNYNCGFEKFKKVFLSELRKYSRNRNLDPIKEYEDRNQKFEESKIYKFNDCDTIYIPKGYTLQEAIDWYTSEYDSIDNDILSEVNYLDGFWDSDVPRERAYEIYKDNPSNFDMYDLSKDKKVQEGTIEYRFGDLYIFKTFKTAKEENDKLNSEIFIICSTEF